MSKKKKKGIALDLASKKRKKGNQKKRERKIIIFGDELEFTPAS